MGSGFELLYQAGWYAPPLADRYPLLPGPRPDVAQRRLHARYKTMTARGKPAAVAVTAMARELAGFVWAEMTS